MKEINAEHITALLDLINRGPYFELLKLLAHGTSKLMILDGKQSVEHAIEAIGFQALPPKFS